MFLHFKSLFKNVNKCFKHFSYFFLELYFWGFDLLGFQLRIMAFAIVSFGIMAQISLRAGALIY
jgi:hypothetical protein